MPNTAQTPIESKGRDSKGRIVKGYTLPGGGRKKLRDTHSIRDLARSYAVKALSTLNDIMTDPEENSSNRVKAASVLLDRAYGTPTNTVNMELHATASTHTPEGMSLEALRATVLERIAQEPVMTLDAEEMEVEE